MTVEYQIDSAGRQRKVVLLDPNAPFLVILKNARYARGLPRARYWYGSPCYWMIPLDVTVHVILPQVIARPLPRCARLLRLTSTRWDRSWLDSDSPITLGRFSYAIIRPLLAPENNRKISLSQKKR